jgi:hypothetical protein
MLHLLLVFFAASIFASAPCKDATSPRYKRREFRELIDHTDPENLKLFPEGQAYIDDVLCLMNEEGTSAEGASIWDDFSKGKYSKPC